MSMIKAILKTTQDLAHPPKILTFDSPQQMAVAYSLLHWANYECSSYKKRGYKELDLSTHKLLGLSSPTKHNTLELQTGTVLSAINRYNTALYKQSGTGDFISSDITKVRGIKGFHEAITACDKLLGRTYIDKGIENLRQDLLSGDTFDLGIYRSQSYNEGHSPSQFTGSTIDSYWVVSTKDIVLIVKPPIYAHADKDGQLHCGDGPAVEYEDGYQVWAWRGWVLKKDYILKPSTLPYDMHKDPNFDGLYWIEDHKRFYDLAELVGYPYFFKHARDKKVLDEDYDRKKCHRQLVHIDWRNWSEGHLHLIVLGDGKDRAYLKVPEDLETCAQAVAWSFGKAVREYQPIEET
uniref:DUF6745 domain-containing protein n=1 Tax=viral metagenome TaxID=1070528 RepID=A0A6M3KMJ5_9ZZZZ